MLLVDPGQYQLTPNVGAALSGGIQNAQNIQQMRQTAEDRAEKKKAAALAGERQQMIGDLTQKIVSGLDRSDPTVAQLAALDPAAFDTAFKQIGLIDNNKKQEAAAFAYDLQNTPQDQRQAKINMRIQTLQGQGRDSSDTAQLINMPPEQQDMTLKFIQMGSLPLEKRMEFSQKGQEIDIKAEEVAIKGEGLAIDREKLAGEAEMRPWNIKKIQSDISKTNAETSKVLQEAMSKKAELEQARNADVTLSKDGEKLINDAVIESANLRSLSHQYETLANQFTTDIASGVPGKAAESVKKLYGSENKITRLRQEYQRLRNSQVLQSLPPGVASDKDIEIAMGAFPADTANPVELAAFLRGVAKLQKYDAKLNEIKAEWVNGNGTLGKSRNPVTVGGRAYPRGVNFNDVAMEQLTLVSPVGGNEQKQTAGRFEIEVVK